MPSLTPSESEKPSSGPSLIPSGQPSSIPSGAPSCIDDGKKCGEANQSDLCESVCCSMNSKQCPNSDPSGRYCCAIGNCSNANDPCPS
eukprot:scaffold12362_cov88-Skeletonema_marinoi.AAC.1